MNVRLVAVWTFVAFCVSGSVSLFASPIASPVAQTARKNADGRAANSVEAALSEHAIDAEQISALKGKSANVLLQDGTLLEDAEFTDVTTRRRPDRVSLFRFKHDGKRRKYPADKVYSLSMEGNTFQVNFLPSMKAAALVDLRERRKAVTKQLQNLGRKFWVEFSDDQQSEYVKQHKLFLKKVVKHFARSTRLRLTETKYFLFLTDMPENQVKPYLRQLDAMNVEMGRAFGFKPGHNIWQGKAVVVAFVNRPDFVEFEREFMKNDSVSESVQGMCHSDSTGRVIVGCYRGKSASYLSAVLVHETAHGYVARFRTNARLPQWLNEGIADWIAGVAVPSTKAIATRQRKAAERLRTYGTFGGQFFDSSKMESWKYGAASSIVNMLIAKDPVRFKLFVNGIKDGLPWKMSLRRAYNASIEELSLSYGRSIGIPRLTP